MSQSKPPQVIRVYIERQGLPNDGKTPEQVAADDLFGVQPRDDFPGIIYETMVYPWTVITLEYDAPVRGPDGKDHLVRWLYSTDLDETPRAELIKRRAQR